MKKISILAIVAILMVSCSKELLVNEPGNLVPKTVDEDPGLPSITVNGARLHAEAFGHPDSTLVVCVHGGPGSDYRYMLNCVDLATYGYRVVFYDQRGSGLSQRFSHDSYTSLGSGALDLIYDELGGVIAHYKTHPNQKVFLLGDSWGAMLITGYVSKYPDAVQALVVSEPGGLRWDDVVEYVKESRSFKLWSESLNDASFIDQFISGKKDQHEILDYKAAMLASENEITGEDNTAPGSFWRSGAVINAALFEVGDRYKPDFSSGISDFKVPVLYFHSEKNQAHPLSWAQRISGAYPSVELAYVPGTGHSGIISDRKAWTETTLPKILTYFSAMQSL